MSPRRRALPNHCRPADFYHRSGSSSGHPSSGTNSGRSCNQARCPTNLNRQNGPDHSNESSWGE